MEDRNLPLAVSIPVGRYSIQGDLTIPRGSVAAVIFAHGSGSSRHSPRNKYVAETLNERGLSTLLIDLLTTEEETIDNQTADSASTFASLRTAWLRPRIGCDSNEVSQHCVWDTSAQVQAPPQRLLQLPSAEMLSMPLFLVAAALT